MSPTGRLAWAATAITLALGAAAARAEAPQEPLQAAENVAGFSAYAPAEEIVITARQPGPAVWRLTRGAAEVIFIGVPAQSPKGQAVDLRRIDRLLEGASALYIYRSGVRLSTSNPLDLFRAPGWLAARRLLRGETIRRAVSAEAFARYEAAAAETGATDKIDETLKPFFFGSEFERAVARRRGLEADGAIRSIVKLAAAHRLNAKPLDEYPLSGVIDELLNMSPSDGARCFDESVSRAAFMSSHAQTAARAWAEGDLRTTIANTPRLDLSCLAGMPVLYARLSGRMDEVTRMVGGLLGRPGRTVIALPLQLLIAQGGVLEKLHATGAEISSPPL